MIIVMNSENPQNIAAQQAAAKGYQSAHDVSLYTLAGGRAHILLPAKLVVCHGLASSSNHSSCA